MRCEICGKEAPYSTETYDPMEGKARTICLCKEHQEKMYMRIVDCMLDMGSSYITESEEDSVIQRKMRYNYRSHWQGNDCCMNCMHLFFVGPDGLACDVIGGRVYKGDTCSAFKRRGYVINEDTPAERILERIKETMDDGPMPIVTTPDLESISERLKEIGKVLAWLYSQGILMNGRDDHIEELLNNIAKEGEE